MNQARCQLVLSGRVQGVGMRPAVARLARKFHLAGQVANAGGEVVIDLFGTPKQIERFVATLPRKLPPLARLDTIRHRDPPAPPGGGTAEVPDRGFLIAPGEVGDADPSLAALPPDLAPCRHCLAEMADPADRRYRYPFINCLDCGPRISLLHALPWQRQQTGMAAFALCPDCRREYEDPASRRYHAEVIACPRCGPQLALLGPGGEPLAHGEAALGQTLAALRQGRIIALKAVGGFQLLVDATDAAAVARLRARKGRPDKPLAVMFENPAQAARYCRLTTRDRRLLQGPAAPILLVPAAPPADLAACGEPPLAPQVAPGTPLLGAMLPASPLHQLLLGDFGAPLVATSGNHSGEPLAAETNEALAQLADVADYFLTHDRPILRRADDSVVRLAAGRPALLRRARGYPVTVITGTMQRDTPAPWVLALGGYQKVAPAVWHAGELTVLPPVGDLGTPAARALLRRSLSQLPLPPRGPDVIACDSHPDYPTGTLARELADDPAARPDAAGDTPRPRVVAVPHHLAHVAAVLAEHPGARPGQMPGQPLLGMAWDGTGHHPAARDAAVLGSECLLLDGGDATRFASLLPFALPGGERAAREPWRCALGLLHSLLGDALWQQPLPPVTRLSGSERRLLAQMLSRGTGCTTTSSAGRLFDGVAALLGLCQTASYEAQAAIALELSADPRGRCGYPLPLMPAPGPAAGAATVAGLGEPAGARPQWYLDWRPLLRALLADLAQGVAPASVAGAFHRALARAMVSVATLAGVRQVVLGGGCLQNRLLLEMTVRRLRSASIAVHWPRQLPAGDGALAAGQAFWAAGVLQGSGIVNQPE